MPVLMITLIMYIMRCFGKRGVTSTPCNSSSRAGNKP